MAEYFNWITFQEVEKQEQKETRILIEKALRLIGIYIENAMVMK